MAQLCAYLRVSSSEQAQDATIELQREAVAAWAQREAHDIASWHEDVGISGAESPGKRVGLADALARVKDDGDGLVVYNLARLARDLVLQEQLLQQVRELGKRVYSTFPTEDAYLTDDPRDPTRRFIRQILGATAEYERGLIRLRLMAGIERKRARGGYVGGKIPFGYRLEGDDLVEHPEEQQAIALARELYSAGGKSLRAIGADLLAAGFKPRGKAFHPELVRSIVSNGQRTRT